MNRLYREISRSTGLHRLKPIARIVACITTRFNIYRSFVSWNISSTTLQTETPPLPNYFHYASHCFATSQTHRSNRRLHQNKERSNFCTDRSNIVQYLAQYHIYKLLHPITEWISSERTLNRYNSIITIETLHHLHPLPTVSRWILNPTRDICSFNSDV